MWIHIAGNCTTVHRAEFSCKSVNYQINSQRQQRLSLPYRLLNPFNKEMGTNRRSRLRSAARILNTGKDAKRQRTSPCTLTEDDTPDSFPHRDDDDAADLCPDSMVFAQGSTTTHDSITVGQETLLGQNEVLLLEGTNSTSNSCIMETPSFTMSEICSYELMTILDNAGCPLNTYEQVVTLLKRQEKRGFSYSKAHSREKLLNVLRQKFHCPKIQSSIVNNCEVFSFPFQDMLQDLVDTAGNSLHIVTQTQSAKWQMTNCGTQNGCTTPFFVPLIPTLTLQLT